MEPERLRIFLTVAQVGSFSEAARRLYISHSTVSRAVAALEEELGLPLVRRGNRVFGLTKAGRALAREAEALLAETEKAAERVRRAAREETENEY